MGKSILESLFGSMVQRRAIVEIWKGDIISI